MLLNLSNHPSNNWGRDQKDAAIKQFGGILDFPFPNISPSASLIEVQDLAMSVFKQILALEIPNLSIHLMGEFTFCYQLLKLFEIQKIKCFASTTIRVVTIKPDGMKMSVFQFKEFRPYY